MSSVISTEISEIKPEKSVKRVRFSDEVKNVYEYEAGENVETISLENEDCAVSGELNNLGPNEFFNPDSVNISVDSISTNNIIKSNISLTKCCDNEIDCIEYSKNLTTANDICKNVNFLQSSNNFVSYIDNDTSSTAYASNSEILDLNQLIHETQLMTISPLEKVEENNQSSSSAEHSSYSTCESNSEKNILGYTMQSTEQKSHTDDNESNLSRKRSSEGMMIKKQTSKLNSCLRKNNSEINSSVDIRNAVFNAWYKVKSERTLVKSASFEPGATEKNVASQISDQTFQNIKDRRGRRSKKQAKKVCFKIPKQIPQKTKEDIEESKMAFHAWKKKKDELLNQQSAEERRKEKKKKLDLLMNERMRKNVAESAYLAWLSHKAAVIKMEKKKKQWFSEKESERINEKIKRSDEAAKIYYEWLRSKIYSEKKSFCKIIEDKPPWTPPGKANNLF